MPADAFAADYRRAGQQRQITVSEASAYGRERKTRGRGARRALAHTGDRGARGSSLAELERHVRVRVERVSEGDTVVAVCDIPFGYENRG